MLESFNNNNPIYCSDKIVAKLYGWRLDAVNEMFVKDKQIQSTYWCSKIK